MPPSKENESEYEARMTFIEHLRELRTRIIRAGIALIIGVIAAYLLSEQIIEILLRPLLTSNVGWVSQANGNGAEQNGDGAAEKEAPRRPAFKTLSLFEPVTVTIKVAGYGGLALAMPFILYQACAFIFPGLKRNEKRAALFLLFGGGALVVAGMFVAYTLILPFVIPYLGTWTPDFVEQEFQLSATVTQIVVTLLGFAAAFQFPLIVLILVYLDLVTPQALAAHRKYAIVGLAFISAVFTPPDPYTMMFMLIPLALMYELSILLAHLIVWKRRKAEAASAAAAR